MRKAWLPSALTACVLLILAVAPARAQERGTTDDDAGRTDRSRSYGSEVTILRGTTPQKEDNVNVVVPPPAEAKPEPQKMITNHRRRSYKTPAK